MRFHALLPVRDEDDVIRECILRLTEWCDCIWIYDTGSADQTWEIVQELARAHKQVRPIEKRSIWWVENLRSMLFHAARKEAEPGDWFVRVDADEIYHVPPPEFVKSRLRSWETMVYRQYFEFRLTHEEMRAYPDEAAILEDRKRPIEDRRRFYITEANYTEPRMFRYRPTMKWIHSAGTPFFGGIVAEARLPIRHYPHRDPLQLEKRFALRSRMYEKWKAEQPTTGIQWAEKDWRTVLMPRTEPGLVEWKYGEAIPDPHLTTQVAPPFKRMTQRMVQAFLVEQMDARKPGFPDGFQPESAE